jgi:hypothetical protein
VPLAVEFSLLLYRNFCVRCVTLWREAVDKAL